MIYSWLVAFTYAIVYSGAILLTKYKAKQRLIEHQDQQRKGTAKKGLIQNQQNLTPNRGTIDEENPSDDTNTNKSQSTKQATTNSNTNTTQNTNGRSSHIMSESVDLTQIHQQLHTSVPYGAPVSNWECFIAILHSVDAGLHLGLLVEMIRDSQRWNLQEQYLLICLFILLSYRIISFLTIYYSLPRYSYSKSVKQSAQNNPIINEIINENGQDVTTLDHHHNNNIDQLSSNNRSCLSYCWLQFFFDFGYVMELAPWLWNWEHTKIILPEFAWFSKMRTLLQSFPFAILMVVSLLAIDNETSATHIHIYFTVTLFISILTIVFSLSLYDHRTLATDDGKLGAFLYISNFAYRIFSCISRIIILSFLIALFPWYLLFFILLIPIIAYSGPYQLGNSDAEPLNLIYQSLLIFPDYSAPFGKISLTETYLNSIHKLHLAVIIIFGAPLIIIFIIVEKIVNKILKIDAEIISMNKDKYASFRITTYTLSRFVESTIELLIISAELYSPVFKSRLLIKDALLVHFLFWTSVVLSVLAPIPFFKFYDEFVVDNEDDYELWYGINEEKTKGYIMGNDEYNTNKDFVDVGSGEARRHSQMNNDVLPGNNHNLNSHNLHIRGSRQYLRQKQYWIAVHRNNYKELAWVLRSRQHVNLLEYNEQEQLGIIIVALRHDWDCLKLLIKHGGGLRHLVRYAALHGEVEILQYLHETLLINMSNILDNADEALLFSAIEGSQPKIVSLLCKYGANVKADSTEGEAPAIIAAKKGELEILKILGANGVDLTVADEQGNTVAHYAAQVYSGKHVLSYLSASNSSCDINYFNSQNKRGATAAYNAAWKGQISNLEVLRDAIGADFSLSNNDGNNCLVGAAMNDQPMVVTYLLDECKLDIDYSNDCQETAVFWAASNGCLGCLEVLIKHGANLEKCDKYGITPLMVSSEHGEAKAVQCLLDAGADCNHQNQDGETALMKACAEGFIDCVKALIEYSSPTGANTLDHTMTDDEGNPAILWCCMTGNMQIFKYLVVEALKLNKQDIEDTVNNDKETCIDWIVENKLDVGLEVLQDLGIQVSAYLDDEDEDGFGQDEEDGFGQDGEDQSNEIDDIDGERNI